MKLFQLPFVAGMFLTATASVYAAESLIFDSTDNYLGGCQFTNKSTWQLPKDFTVSKIQLWYKWNTGETSLPVTVFHNNEKFASFDAKRGNCDPYQTTWCNADYDINTLFPAGTYSTEISDRRQCLKPGGTGTVRLYSDDNLIPDNSPTSAQIPTAIIQPSTTAAAVQPVTAENQLISCSCNQPVIIATAAALSSALSIGISLFLKKR